MRLFLTSLLGFVCLLMNAQNTEGIVVYKHTDHPKQQLLTVDPNAPKDIVDKTPDSIMTVYQLKFQAAYAHFKEVAYYQGDTTKVGKDKVKSSVTRLITSKGTYTDQAQNLQFDEMDFVGTKFLIKEPISTIRWEISKKKKKILGYKCTAATVVGDTVDGKPLITTAWFTPDIPVKFGPKYYGGLPGLILEIDIDNGAIVTSATKITLGKLPANSIVEPKDGIPQTRAEFTKFYTEKLKLVTDMINAEKTKNLPGGTKIIQGELKKN